MAQYFEDFSAFTVGETGPSGFTKRAGTSTNLLIQADASAPGGKSLQLTRTSSNNDFVEWDAIGSDENRGTLDFVALVRVNAWNASTAAFTVGGIVGRSAGITVGTLDAFYGMIGSDTGQSSSGAQLRARELIDGSGTLVKSPTTGTWTIDTLYWLRLRLSGTTGIVSLYHYADPLGTPIDEITNTASAANGIDRVGLHVFASTSNLSFLYLAAGTGGDTPPLPSGDTSAPALTSPSASATGATTASGSVTTNEASGMLYYLASANASEAAATVKVGSSQAVSATGSQPVNLTGLTASTSYYLHFVHRDAAGNDSAVASSAQFTTSALDTTPPTLTGPTASATGATTASGSVSTNEATGTLYWIASANASESAASVKSGNSQAVSATGTQSVSVSGLTASTSYYMHYLHRDGAGNDSAVAASAQFTTEAEPVVVKGASIALYNGATPQASIAGIRALWWDAPAPYGAAPDFYSATASTDASGVLTLDLDVITALDVGDYGYLLLHKDGTLGNLYRDALEFAGAVQITDIS